MGYKLHPNRQKQVYIKEKNQFCSIKEMSYDFCWVTQVKPILGLNPFQLHLQPTHLYTIIFPGDVPEEITTPSSMLALSHTPLWSRPKVYTVNALSFPNSHMIYFLLAYSYHFDYQIAFPCLSSFP